MRLAFFKQLFLIISAALLLSGCSEQGGQPQGNVGAGKGQAAPVFSLPDMQGRQVSLASLQGRVVILNFWATWCPPCREEMPSMEMLYRKYKDQGLVLLAVNVEEDGKELVQSFLQRTPYTFPILLDSDADVQNLYNVFRFPQTFIIDREGNVVKDVVGAIDWTTGPTFELIKTLLSG